MDRPKGRRLVFGLLAVVTATVAASAVILRDPIREQYHILRLRSIDAAIREESLEQLVELRSLRAVPAIIRMKLKLRDASYDPLPDLAAPRRGEFLRLLESIAAGKEADPRVRCFAIYLLSELGADAPVPSPALEAALQAPHERVWEFAGIALAEMERKRRDRNQKRGTVGVVVTETQGALAISRVMNGSPAWRASLRQGDQLLSANGMPLGTIDSLARALAGARVGDPVAFLLQRGPKRITRTLFLDSEATWASVVPKLWEP